jgi:hypothetical protein
VPANCALDHRSTHIECFDAADVVPEDTVIDDADVVTDVDMSIQQNDPSANATRDV